MISFDTEIYKGKLDRNLCQWNKISVQNCQSINKWIFIARPTERASATQGHFLGGSGRRAGAHMRPALSKNTYGPVGIPLIRGASRTRQ